jgi:hypothetical protein
MPSKDAALPFFTIGHSTRSLEDFIALLGAAAIERIVDIRTVPRSRTNPQFNKDTLPKPLKAAGISYEHLADLGGLRGKARSVPPSVNGFWSNESFHNYADYALSPQFHAALQHLRDEPHRCRLSDRVRRDRRPHHGGGPPRARPSHRRRRRPGRRHGGLSGDG